MRVLIACGGTGGHVFPGLSVAEEIKRRRPEARFLFLGAKKHAIPPGAGLCFGEEARVVRLPAIGMPRRISTDVPSFVLRLIGSFDVSFRVVANFRPHVAIGFGNFSSVAPLFAAKLLGVPVAIHEANAVPGKANLLLSKLSSVVLVNFPESGSGFPNRNVEVVGMPLRKEFLQPQDRLGALANLKMLGSTLFTLLVVGGSQGARALNRAVCNALPVLQRMAAEVQVIHLTGSADYPWVRRCYEALSLRAYVAPFESRMKSLFDAADLVVARSGASTVAEIIQTAKPAILVPFPYAASGHQEQNARYLEAKGGAVVLRETTPSLGPTPSSGGIPGFTETLCQLIADRGGALRVMEMNTRQLANGNAARKIADVLFRIMDPQRSPRALRGAGRGGTGFQPVNHGQDAHATSVCASPLHAVR